MTIIATFAGYHVEYHNVTESTGASIGTKTENVDLDKPGKFMGGSIFITNLNSVIQNHITGVVLLGDFSGSLSFGGTVSIARIQYFQDDAVDRTIRFGVMMWVKDV